MGRRGESDLGEDVEGEEGEEEVQATQLPTLLAPEDAVGTELVHALVAEEEPKLAPESGHRLSYATLLFEKICLEVTYLPANTN